MRRRFFQNTISAICYEMMRDHGLISETSNSLSISDVERFVLGQLERMPRLLRVGIEIMTGIFSVTAWFYRASSFQQLNAETRHLHIVRWRCALIQPCRDLMRFYESLVVLCVYSSLPDRTVSESSR